MAYTYVYEESYFASGWFDGKTLPQWFDRDITSLNGVIIQLDFLQPGVFHDPDVIYAPDPLTIITFPGFFVDPDVFFVPMSARALDAPDKALKNEIIRVR